MRAIWKFYGEYLLLNLIQLQIFQLKVPYLQMIIGHIGKTERQLRCRKPALTWSQLFEEE
jgi:hypothetical protein